MFFRVLMCLLLLCFSMPSFAQDMSVSDAYKAIPHKQTTFDAQQSRLAKADAKYLEHYFYVADIAVRARVMALRGFWGQDKSLNVQDYDAQVHKALSSFEVVNTPKHLKEAETLLIGAIKDQQAFFHEWDKLEGDKRKEMGSNYVRHRLGLSAHQKLIRAYFLIKNAYPREEQHNVEAFFDHLCALDFI